MEKRNETCEIIYDILRNRLSMPEEECTYELASDIFDAIIENMNMESHDKDYYKVLSLYEHSLDNDLDILRDLYADYPDNKYTIGYFNGVNSSKMVLLTMKKLAGLDGGNKR